MKYDICGIVLVAAVRPIEKSQFMQNAHTHAKHPLAIEDTNLFLSHRNAEENLLIIIT